MNREFLTTRNKGELFECVMERIMEAQQAIGCIGKCTSGLSVAELDQITDNINKTLNHPRGRKIFKRFLERLSLTDNLNCLKLYEMCSEVIENEKRSQLTMRSLIRNVTEVKEEAEDLEGVPEIDRALLGRFGEALDDGSRNSLLIVLVDTRNCCRDHLKFIHENFKKYASEPCPMNRVRN